MRDSACACVCVRDTACACACACVRVRVCVCVRVRVRIKRPVTLKADSQVWCLVSRRTMNGWLDHNGPHTLTQALNPVRVHVCLALCHAGSLPGDLGRAGTAGQRMQRGGEMEETAPCNLAQSLLSVRLC